MQQIAGCAMPLLDRSDWIDSSRLFVGFPHRKQKEINKQLTKKVKNDSCKKRFRNWKSCCSGFMLAFRGVLWIIPSNVYAVFFLISCLVVICGQTNLLTSLALVVWLKFPMIFHLGFFGPYPLASSTNDCEES